MFDSQERFSDTEVYNIQCNSHTLSDWEKDYFSSDRGISFGDSSSSESSGSLSGSPAMLLCGGAFAFMLFSGHAIEPSSIAHALSAVNDFVFSAIHWLVNAVGISLLAVGTGGLVIEATKSVVEKKKMKIKINGKEIE